MTINQIRARLDRINSEEIDAYNACMIWRIEEEWSRWNGTNLGELRDVIEDRLHLAHTKRVAAGY